MNSYVGVIGFTKGLEIKEVLEALPDNRKLMAGVSLNKDLLNGETPPNRNKYPIQKKDISEDIFISDERVANFIKFEDEIASMGDLFRLRIWGGKNLEGLILSKWPSVEKIEDLKEATGLKIILEIPRQDYKEDFLELCRELWPFKDHIDGVIVENCCREHTDDCIEYLSTQYKESQIAIKGLTRIQETSEIDYLLFKYPFMGIVMEDDLRDYEGYLGLRTTRKYLQYLQYFS